MRTADGKEFAVWEWAILFGVTAAAIATTDVVGLSQRWEDAVVYTVALFAIVIMALRAAWRRPGFWQNLLLVFALHVVGIAVLISVLPLGTFGVPKIFWSISLIVEALLVGSVLWKRVAAAKRRP